MAHDDAGTFPVGKGRRSAFRAPDRQDDGGSDAPGGPSRSARSRAATPSRPVAFLGAVAGGTIAAVFGTLLHAHLLRVGSVEVPVGALAALVLAGSVFLFCGLWARNIVLTALAGAVGYGAVALLSTSSKTLILTGSSDAAPGTAVAGNLWLFGVLVMTLAAVVIGSVLLRPRAHS